MADRPSRPPPAPNAVHPPVAFFDRTYDEAFALTRAARDYIAGFRATGGDRPPAQALAVSLESMRLTTRVVQVMAWCLAQKAIFAGELVCEPATVEWFALSGREVCLGGKEEAESASMPERLRVLLKESRALYIRVLRLDKLLYRELDVRA